jgi:hypothetical protein
MRLRRIAPTAAVLCATLVPARAAAQDLWGELQLPGGAPAARAVLALGDAAGRPDSGWLLDFIRRYDYQTGASAARTALQRYVAFIEAVRTSASAWPDGCRLPTAAMSRSQRDRIVDFLELLGLAVYEDHGRFTVKPDEDRAARERADWLAGAGVEQSDLVARLNAGQPVAIHIPDSTLPLPLPAFWAGQVFRQRDQPPIAAFANDVAAAYTYFGLMALDRETLAFLARDDQLVRHLYENAAPVLAAFGRSMRVHAGVVDTPGANTAPIWEALVGQRTSQPDRFLRELATRDEGWLAFFYDTVDHLDEVHQAAVLGGRLQGRARIDFARRVYDAFKEFQSTWTIAVQPFHRPDFDPALALTFVDVGRDGTVGPAWWPSLFGKVTGSSSWPDHPDREVQSLEKHPADLAWMLRWLADNREEALERFQVLRFAQRSFAGLGPEHAADMDVALRAFRDLPALSLVLERMGVRSPATQAHVATKLRALTYGGGRDEVEPALAAWQSALGLLEQIQRRRRFPEATLTPLLTSLADAAQAQPGHADGRVAAWLLETLLPALGCDPTDTADPEAAAVRAFVTRPDESPVELTWEGLSYALDWRSPTVASALGVRRAHPGLTLTDLMKLQAIRHEMETGPKTVGAVQALVAPISAIQARLAEALPATDGQPPDIVNDLRDVAETLSRVKRPDDVHRASEKLPVVLRAIDAATAAAVPALEYALAVSPTGQPPSLYADLWTRHRIGGRGDAPLKRPGKVVVESWQRIGWHRPSLADETGGGKGLQGALVGLDIALADSQPRALAPFDATSPPDVDDFFRLVLLQGLVVGDAALMSEDVGHRAASAIAAGRAKVAAWVARPPAAEDLRAALLGAGVSEWRANLFAWDLARTPALAADHLTMENLFYLGTTGELPVAFGGSSVPIDGCLCQLRKPRLAVENVLGHWALGLPAAVFSDIRLRLAEHLAAMHLPAALVPAVLPGAVQDFLDHVHQFSPDDWDAPAAWAAHLSQTRVEQYLMGLVSLGVLAPPKGGGDVR